MSSNTSGLIFTKQGAAIKRHLHGSGRRFGKKFLYLDTAHKILIYTDSPKQTPSSGTRISLIGATIDRSEAPTPSDMGHHFFSILGERPYSFGVPSFEEARQWCDALEDAIGVHSAIKRRLTEARPRTTSAVAAAAAAAGGAAGAAAGGTTVLNTGSTVVLSGATMNIMGAIGARRGQQSSKAQELRERRKAQEAERRAKARRDELSAKYGDFSDEDEDAGETGEGETGEGEDVPLTAADLESAFVALREERRIKAQEAQDDVLHAADDVIDSAGVGAWVLDAERQPQLVPERMLGKFFSSDVYVIMEFVRASPMVYVWVGRNAEQAVAGVAAFWAVRLCSYIQNEYGYSPLQERVDEGDEPDDFVGLWYRPGWDGMEVSNGSILPHMGLDPSLGLLRRPLPPEYEFFYVVGREGRDGATAPLFRQILPTELYLLHEPKQQRGMFGRKKKAEQLPEQFTKHVAGAIAPHRARTAFILVHSITGSSSRVFGARTEIFVYTPGQIDPKFRASLLETVQVVRACYAASRVVILSPYSAPCDIADYNSTLALAAQECGLPFRRAAATAVAAAAAAHGDLVRSLTLTDVSERLDEDVDALVVDAGDLTPTLHQVTLGPGGLAVAPVAKGYSGMHRRLLESSGCYYVEFDGFLHVWLGKDAAKVERAAAVRAAQSVIGPESGLEVVIAYEGCEPASLAACFCDWAPFLVKPKTVVSANLCAVRDDKLYKPFPADSFAWNVPDAVRRERIHGDLLLHRKDVATTGTGIGSAGAGAAQAAAADLFGGRSADIRQQPAPEPDTMLEPRICYHIADFRSASERGSDLTSAEHYSTDCHATLAVGDNRVILFLWQGRYSSPASAVTFQQEVSAEINERLTAARLAQPEVCVIQDGAEPKAYIEMWLNHVGGLLVRTYGATKRFLPLHMPSSERMHPAVRVFRVDSGVAREIMEPILHPAGTYIVLPRYSDGRGVAEAASRSGGELLAALPAVWAGRLATQEEIDVALDIASWYCDPEDEDDVVSFFRQGECGIPDGFELIDNRLKLRPRLLVAAQRTSNLVWSLQDGTPSAIMCTQESGAAGIILDGGNVVFALDICLDWFWKPKFEEETKAIAQALGAVRLKPARPLPVVRVQRGREYAEWRACFVNWPTLVMRRDVADHIGSQATWSSGSPEEARKQWVADIVAKGGFLLHVHTESPPDWTPEDQTHWDEVEAATVRRLEGHKDEAPGSPPASSPLSLPTLDVLSPPAIPTTPGGSSALPPLLRTPDALPTAPAAAAHARTSSTSSAGGSSSSKHHHHHRRSHTSAHTSATTPAPATEGRSPLARTSSTMPPPLPSTPKPSASSTPKPPASSTPKPPASSTPKPPASSTPKPPASKPTTPRPAQPVPKLPAAPGSRTLPPPPAGLPALPGLPGHSSKPSGSFSSMMSSLPSTAPGVVRPRPAAPGAAPALPAFPAGSPVVSPGALPAFK